MLTSCSWRSADRDGVRGVLQESGSVEQAAVGGGAEEVVGQHLLEPANVRRLHRADVVVVQLSQARRGRFRSWYRCAYDDPSRFVEQARSGRPVLASSSSGFRIVVKTRRSGRALLSIVVFVPGSTRWSWPTTPQRCIAAYARHGRHVSARARSSAGVGRRPAVASSRAGARRRSPGRHRAPAARAGRCTGPSTRRCPAATRSWATAAREVAIGAQQRRIRRDRRGQRRQGGRPRPRHQPQPGDVGGGESLGRREERASAPDGPGGGIVRFRLAICRNQAPGERRGTAHADLLPQNRTHRQLEPIPCAGNAQTGRTPTSGERGSRRRCAVIAAGSAARSKMRRTRSMIDQRRRLESGSRTQMVPVHRLDFDDAARAVVLVRR